MISGFRLKVDEICCLLGYYAACSSNSLSAFRDNLMVPSSKVKKYSCPLKMVQSICPEISGWNYHYTLRNISEECRSYEVIFMTYLACLQCLSSYYHRNENKCKFLWSTQKKVVKFLCFFLMLLHQIGGPCSKWR